MRGKHDNLCLNNGPKLTLCYDRLQSMLSFYRSADQALQHLERFGHHRPSI